MEYSRCGKNCDDCLEREEVGCPGCMKGPGKEKGALCEIAQCCEDRGEAECALCRRNDTCSILAERERMMQKWNANKKSEAVGMPYAASVTGMNGAAYTESKTGKSRDGRDAAFIRSSLLAIFWLFIASGIGNVLSEFSFVPGLAIISSLVALGASIARAVILIRLGREEDAYKVSGICTIVAFPLAFLGGVLSAVGIISLSSLKAMVILALVCIIASVVLEIIAVYKFLMANAWIVDRRDIALSERWKSMAKWFLLLLGIAVVLILILMAVPMLGVLLVFAYLLGVLAFGICEYVFLYQTANRFRE